MKYLTQNPNLSIVVPGNCNAKCNFCFWKYQKPSDNYLLELKSILNNLPERFNQISLTGGEPCKSSYLIHILNLIDKKKFPKVVLTTNGFNLLYLLKNYPDTFKYKINYINISRHDYSDSNNELTFNSKTVPSSILIKEAIKVAKSLGIDVTINCVINNYMNDPQEFVYSMIGFVNEVGAKEIAFRKEHGDLSSTLVEDYFSERYPVIAESGCPVCRSKLQKILGTSVIWKASSIEPSKEGDGIYEVIIHPNGKATIDWEGKIEFKEEEEESNPLENEEEESNPLENIADALISIGNELKSLTQDKKPERKIHVCGSSIIDDKTGIDITEKYIEQDKKTVKKITKEIDNDDEFPDYSELIKKEDKKEIKKEGPIYSNCGTGCL